MEDKINQIKLLLEKELKEDSSAIAIPSASVYDNFVKGKKREGRIEVLRKVIGILEG